MFKPVSYFSYVCCFHLPIILVHTISYNKESYIYPILFCKKYLRAYLSQHKHMQPDNFSFDISSDSN